MNLSRESVPLSCETNRHGHGDRVRDRPGRHPLAAEVRQQAQFRHLRLVPPGARGARRRPAPRRCPPALGRTGAAQSGRPQRPPGLPARPGHPDLGQGDPARGRPAAAARPSSGAGGILVDTAAAYAAGDAERMHRTHAARRGRRARRLVIATKAGFGDPGRRPGRRHLPRRSAGRPAGLAAPAGHRPHRHLAAARVGRRRRWRSPWPRSTPPWPPATSATPA